MGCISKLLLGPGVSHRLIRQTKTEQTQKACPSGLQEPAIVLFGIITTSLGTIIALKFCNEGTIIWLF